MHKYSQACLIRKYISFTSYMVVHNFTTGVVQCVYQMIITRRVYVSGSLNDHFLCHRDAVPKQCCGLSSPPVRWSILGVGFVGLVCAGAGTLLGALKASGRDHLVGIFMSGKETHFPYSRLSICEVVIVRR